MEETKDVQEQRVAKYETAAFGDGRLQVLKDDPYLGDFEQDLLLRQRKYQE
jgi:hypothetical protein